MHLRCNVLGWSVKDWNGWRCSWRDAKKATCDFKKVQARVVKQLKGKQSFFAKCAKQVLPAGQRRKPRTKAPEATACQVRKKEKATKLAQLFCKSRGGVWRERRK